MKIKSKNHYIVFAALAALSMSSCASKDSEDDASLQAEEPVAASEAPADSAASAELTAPDQSPEAKPATSVGSDAAKSPQTPAAAEVTAPQDNAHRVMYVKNDGVAIREKADPKSKRIGKLNKGDHVLVTIEGEWARTEDGKYIAAKSLTGKGVAPGKKEATWSSGGKAAEAPSAATSATAASPAKSGEISKKLPKKTKSNKPKAGENAAPTAAPTAAPESPTSDGSAAPAGTESSK